MVGKLKAIVLAVFLLLLALSYVVNIKQSLQASAFTSRCSLSSALS